MRIVFIVAGAGGMYCGTCLQSGTLALALRRAGEDVMVLPAYTPVRTEEDLSNESIVYGGINVYLQQRSALFRHTPRFLDKLLDRPALLNRLAGRSAATRAEDLGALTVSMLRGEDGRQRKELAKLLDVLAELRPDVVHLSTVLLTGMARRIARQLGVPVVANLSGEDTFLERLPEPHYSAARKALRERVGDLAALVALSGYFADFMAEYLSFPRSHIRVIPPGLNLEGYRDPPVQPAPGPDVQAAPVTIGYLGRICEEKGLHQLAGVFCDLARDGALPPLRLVAAGYLGEPDRPYLDRIRKVVSDSGLAERFQYVGELDRAGKIAFLQSLDLVCLPSLVKESKGLPALEAWAAGVPAVLPDHGAFSELVANTQGGLLFPPGDMAAMAVALRQLIEDRALAAECGRRARQVVVEHYHADLMAQRTIELYRSIVG